MEDVLGQAIYDYHHKLSRASLMIHNKYGLPENMPVDMYFRPWKEMPPMEWIALKNCKGEVLDIGAGAGSHALVLQQKGFDVTAIDISEKAVEVMKERGVQKAIVQDIFLYNEKQYDTLLMLMNGIGLAGTVNHLIDFFNHAKTLLKPGGQMLFDSCDVTYLYDEGKLPGAHYYGEVAYQYRYKQHRTKWFNWLYIHKELLTELCVETGLAIKILHEDDHDQYLAKLTVKDLKK